MAIRNPQDHQHSCAVFVDYENIFYDLKDRVGTEKALDDSLDLLSRLRDLLYQEHKTVITIGRAYGDFSRLDVDAQAQLQLLGFEPRFMMATPHKNSSDILLSIDAIDLLHQRPELDLFVLVAGDRDYLAVVRRIMEYGKKVLVVGFQKSTSGDLKGVVGADSFIAADTIIPVAPAASVPVLASRKPETASGRPKLSLGTNPDVTTEPTADGNGSSTDLEICMLQILEVASKHKDVWITPLLHILNDKIPYLDNRARKHLIDRLATRGAIRIEVREGFPNPYSVIVVNWNDPWVQKNHPACVPHFNTTNKCGD